MVLFGQSCEGGNVPWYDKLLEDKCVLSTLVDSFATQTNCLGVLEKVAFEFLGLQLLEPLSTLMNWVLAFECGYLYTRLKGEGSSFKKFWSYYFLISAISFVFGGFSHLIFNYTGMLGKIPNWSLGIIAAACAEMGLISDIEDDKKRRMLLTVIRSAAFASFVMLALDFHFKWVMVAVGLKFVFIIVTSISRYRSGISGYKNFLIGAALLFLMAPVKIGEIDIHPAYFNRDDIAHFLMLPAYWFFFKGVTSVEEAR